MSLGFQRRWLSDIFGGLRGKRKETGSILRSGMLGSQSSILVDQLARRMRLEPSEYVFQFSATDFCRCHKSWPAFNFC